MSAVSQGVGEAPLDAGLDDEAVNDDVDVVFLVLVEDDLLGQVERLAVDDHPDEAVLPELGQLLPVLPLAAADHGGEEGDSRPLRHRHDLVHHLGDGLRGDLLAAVVAGGPPHPGEEEAQVVVDLGHRADRGAGVLAGGLLLDGDGRGKPLDRLHVRLLHLLQELAGIGGEGLHVAALPLGIDGVEGKGRFSRTGDAGDHHQPVPRYLHVDAFQVMLARPFDDDLVYCHGTPAHSLFPGLEQRRNNFQL